MVCVIPLYVPIWNEDQFILNHYDFIFKQITFVYEIFLNALLIEIYVSITDKDPPLCIFMLVDAFNLTSKYNHVVWHPGLFSRYETKSTFSNSVDPTLFVNKFILSTIAVVNKVNL